MQRPPQGPSRQQRTRRVSGAAALLLWFALLPFLARLPLGVDWAAQYLPDAGRVLWGLLFFAAFNSLPGVVLAIAVLGRLALPRAALLLVFLLMSTLTIAAHYGYDLAADAQAAIWLVVAPVYIAVVGIGVLGIAGAATALLHYLQRHRDA